MLTNRTWCELNQEKLHFNFKDDVESRHENRHLTQWIRIHRKVSWFLWKVASKIRIESNVLYCQPMFVEKGNKPIWAKTTFPWKKYGEFVFGSVGPSKQVRMLTEKAASLYYSLLKSYNSVRSSIQVARIIASNMCRYHHCVHSGRPEIRRCAVVCSSSVCQVLRKRPTAKSNLGQFIIITVMAKTII